MYWACIFLEWIFSELVSIQLPNEWLLGKTLFHQTFGPTVYYLTLNRRTGTTSSRFPPGLSMPPNCYQSHCLRWKPPRNEYSWEVLWLVFLGCCPTPRAQFNADMVIKKLFLHGWEPKIDSRKPSIAPSSVTGELTKLSGWNLYLSSPYKTTMWE